VGKRRFGPRRLAVLAAKAVLGGLAVVVLILVGLRIAAAARESGAEPPSGVSRVKTPLGAVAVQVSGPADGPPVLLVHGTAAWSGFWRGPATHLATRGWRVIAVDLPPFGWSEHDPEARYSRTDQAERLSAVLAALAGRPAVVVAHSFGSGAATELALRHPRQVRSLVLVDAALGELDPKQGSGALAASLGFAPLAEGAVAATVTNPAAMRPLLQSMLARKEAADAWVPVLQAPMRREGTTAAYAAWLPNLFVRDDGALSRRSAGLAAIRVPVAVIWGGADTVTPPGQGRRIARLTRARSFAVLPGVGHVPHIEDPDRFLAALDAAVAPDREGRHDAK
jgi:pimeloyl-ACP methyl ester carboxylesterase